MHCPSIANFIKTESSETGMLLEISEGVKTGELHELVLKRSAEGKDVAGTGLRLIGGFWTRGHFWLLLKSGS